MYTWVPQTRYWWCSVCQVGYAWYGTCESFHLQNSKKSSWKRYENISNPVRPKVVTNEERDWQAATEAFLQDFRKDFNDVQEANIHLAIMTGYSDPLFDEESVLTLGRGYENSYEDDIPSDADDREDLLPDDPYF